MPEVLLGRAPHPALHRRGILGDDALDVRLEIARWRRVNRLKAEPKPAARLTDDSTEDHRRPEPQREDGRAAWSLCQPSKEWHPRRRESDGALIDEKGDGTSLGLVWFTLLLVVTEYPRLVKARATLSTRRPTEATSAVFADQVPSPNQANQANQRSIAPNC